MLEYQSSEGGSPVVSPADVPVTHSCVLGVWENDRHAPRLKSRPIPGARSVAVQEATAPKYTLVATNPKPSIPTGRKVSVNPIRHGHSVEHLFQNPNSRIGLYRAVSHVVGSTDVLFDRSKTAKKTPAPRG